MAFRLLESNVRDPGDGANPLSIRRSVRCKELNFRHPCVFAMGASPWRISANWPPWILSWSNSTCSGKGRWELTSTAVPPDCASFVSSPKAAWATGSRPLKGSSSTNSPTGPKNAWARTSF